MTSRAFCAGIVMVGVLNAMNVSVIFAEGDPKKPSEKTQKEGLGLKVDDLPKPRAEVLVRVSRQHRHNPGFVTVIAEVRFVEKRAQFGEDGNDPRGLAVPLCFGTGYCESFGIPVYVGPLQ